MIRKLRCRAQDVERTVRPVQNALEVKENDDEHQAGRFSCEIWAEGAQYESINSSEGFDKTAEQATDLIQETSESHRSTHSKKKGRSEKKKHSETNKSAPVIRKMTKRTVDGAPCKNSDWRRKSANKKKIMDLNKKEKRRSPRERSKSEHRNFVRGASQECEGGSVAKEVGRERGLNTPYVERWDDLRAEEIGSPEKSVLSPAKRGKRQSTLTGGGGSRKQGSRIRKSFGDTQMMKMKQVDQLKKVQFAESDSEI